jgi:hypothetical protein
MIEFGALPVVSAGGLAEEDVAQSVDIPAGTRVGEPWISR